MYVEQCRVIVYLCVNCTLVLLVQCKKPVIKRLLATWRLECELGITIDPECPVDGGWTHWAPWSSCFGNCGNIGHRKRKRQCNNPSPSKDGLSCVGLGEQTDDCYLKNCTVDDFRIIIEGDSFRTEALHQLEAIPILIQQCFQIECPYEAVEAALATENTWQFNSEILWNALLCVKHDLGCSVNGAWGTWGSWSACGARCGKGLKWRSRKCDSPPPSAFHLVCLGIPLQSQECEGDQCAIDAHYTELSVGGIWSEWGAWTKCSETCGPGVRRRKRTCIEKHFSYSAITWKTHCRGQYDEFQICDLKNCLLDGGWSGWGPWGQCSQTCGAGKRSRSRSCTRPIASGGGNNCTGNKVAVDSCHLTPCEVYKNIIAVFNGDSVLQYNYNRKRSTLIHSYLRFLPLSPHGTLIRRGKPSSPMLRVSLHKWHICFDSNGPSKTCSLPRTCSPSPVEPSIWHSLMVTVSNEAVIFRVDDALTSIYSPFPCNPEFTNNEINIFVGERLHAEIQELILNFIPISIFIDQDHILSKTELFPTSSMNMAYEKADNEEAYIFLENEYYLDLPCEEIKYEWQIEVTLKSTKESGTILFLMNYNSNEWFYLILDNMHIKIKYTAGEFKSEDTSSTEFLPDHWLDIIINKRKESNTISVSINGVERLHVLLVENSFRKQRQSCNKSANFINYNYSNNLIDELNICVNKYYIGGLPNFIKKNISQELAPFYGTVAALKVNNELQDLHKINIERYKENTIQLSSRSASLSGSYHEFTWEDTKTLNLTCIYARIVRSTYPAYWLYLDNEIKYCNVSSNNGRITRLSLSADNKSGFYTCRATINGSVRNLITYGVVGKECHKLPFPNTITIIAIITTVSLVIFTLGWLIIEGYNDVCDGYGFFRDNQSSSELKVRNKNQSDCSESIIKLAKLNTRRRCKRLLNQLKRSDQDTEENIFLEDNIKNVDKYSYSELGDLPALPEIKSFITKPLHHAVYRCDPTHSSLPVHITDISLGSCPRNLSSCFISSKYVTSKEKVFLNECIKLKEQNETKPTHLTLKPIIPVNNLIIQNVLKKFYDLKSTDL